MRGEVQRSKHAGFAVVEGLLIVAIIAIVAAVAVFVVHQKHSAENTLASNDTTSGSAPSGTTASIDQITEQDAKTEASADNSADATYQQAATSTDTAANALGGAYNEANY